MKKIAPRFALGLHYDLHAGKQDTELGARCGWADLGPALKLMRPDFVQTDCKGHAGYTSWLSRTPEAAVSPGVVKDALEQWRAATRRLGMPLHVHYSGIWDMAAGASHPDWCVVKADGSLAGPAFGDSATPGTGQKMCPRGPYLDRLLIPQFLELIDRYGVDGFWVDGDLWAVEPCYCPACRAAYKKETGRTEPPVKADDPAWPEWMAFTRAAFEAYVTRYCDAVHAHKPGVRVCSNWLQTFRDPGEPRVPTDWISGDNTWVFGLDDSRCEARFLSTRGKPWDIMLWAFYCSQGMGKPDSPWVTKPAEMLMQEAAVLLSFGGGVQFYENGGGLRDGRLAPWRMKRLGAVARFIRAREELCRDSESIPQVAVLHSERHCKTKISGSNLMWNVDVAPVHGAVFSLLESGYGVDILDEWALMPRLAEFPVVVAPEQDLMSDAMVAALKTYVLGGGRLLVTGAAAFERFGGEFLGVASEGVDEKKQYQVPAADGAVPLYSAQWRRVKAVDAKGFGRLGLSPLLDDRLLPNPAYTIRRAGRGRVAYVPADLFRDFASNRYPLTQAFAGAVARALAGPLDIEVRAPVCVDVALRRKGRRRIVHLVNRASGIPNRPNNGAIDAIPTVGPVTVSLVLPAGDYTVRQAFEAGEPEILKAVNRNGRLRLTVKLAGVRIHAALVVEEKGRPAGKGKRI
jgi:hypothetical protein